MVDGHDDTMAKVFAMLFWLLERLMRRYRRGVEDVSIISAILTAGWALDYKVSSSRSSPSRYFLMLLVALVNSDHSKRRTKNDVVSALFPEVTVGGTC